MELLAGGIAFHSYVWQRMAWLKIRTDLTEHRKVLALSKGVRRPPYWVTGALIKFWGWARANTKDGRLAGITFSDVDRLIGRRSFAENLSKIGWITRDVQGFVVIPRYARWFLRYGDDSRSADSKQPDLYESSEEVSAPRAEQSEREREKESSNSRDKQTGLSNGRGHDRQKSTRSSTPAAAVFSKPGKEIAAASNGRAVEQAVNFVSELERRGLPTSVAVQLCAGSDPALIREVLRFHLESEGRWENSPGALRSMLQNPGKWGFERTASGWKPPEAPANGAVPKPLSDAERRALVARQRAAAVATEGTAARGISLKEALSRKGKANGDHVRRSSE